MTDRVVTAFAPATVSNVACGFDVLGFALEAPGDEVTARPGRVPACSIDDITGDAGRLPREAARNTAGVAAQALLTALGERRGVALSIGKGLPLASGLGGSAASAAAAVVAVDALLERACVARYADRVRARGRGSRRRVGASRQHRAGALRRLRPRAAARSARHRPPAGPGRADGGRRASRSRDRDGEGPRAAGDTVPLADAIRQWANLGALVDGLHRGDFALISRSLEDTIAEPRRASLVPGLAAIKRAAVDAGALGCSLSGSGPSLFALCRGPTIAAARGGRDDRAVTAHIGGEPQTYVSAIARQGARVVSTCAS